MILYTYKSNAFNENMRGAKAMKILEVREAVKYYGNGGNITKALDGLSFSVDKGSFTAIMGASGSGKSTLMNMISAIDTLSSGDVFIDGVSIADMTDEQSADFRRDKLGFVFQDYNLLDTMTVEENIILPLNLRKEKVAKIQEELKRVTDIFGIGHLSAKFPDEISGGERQRVACARALITSPSIILADEPTGALDSANSLRLMKTFSELNKSFSATILMVTHNPEIGAYADRVLFLKDGVIWNEIYKGDRTKKEFYNDIISLIAASGGDNDVF